MSQQQKEPIRRSVVEKRHNPINVMNSEELSNQNRNQKGAFFLNNVEQGSTLNGSVRNEARFQRIKSAHTGSAMRPPAAGNRTVVTQERNYSSPGEVESQSVNLTTVSLMPPKVIRNSPLNTVFQKLVVHDSTKPGVSKQVDPRSQSLVSSNSKTTNHLVNIPEQQEHQPEQQQHLIKPTMIMKRTISKNSDQLLISVKPLNKNQPYASGDSPDPPHSVYSQHGQRPIYSSEDSDVDEDESPLVANRAHLSNKCRDQNDATVIGDYENDKKDAGTGPMFADDIATSLPTFEGCGVEGQTIDNMTDFLNFYNQDLFQLGGGQRNSQQIQSQHRSLKSIAANSTVKIDFNKVVALVVPDIKLFGERQIERALADRGYSSERYICLFLKDIVWMHNYIIALITRRHRAKIHGKVTADGRTELKRRHTPNYLHMRNSNLAPSGHKRLESNTLKQIDDEKQVYNENYQFLVNLMAKGQDIIGRLSGVPLISIKRVISHPQKQLGKIQKIIKDATDKSKKRQPIVQESNEIQQQPIADIRIVTPPLKLSPLRTLQIQKKQMLESDVYPPTVTMSHQMMASEHISMIGTEKILKQIQPMHHLQVVTRVMEQRPPAPPLPKPFSQQNKPLVAASGSTTVIKSARPKSQIVHNKRKNVIRQHESHRRQRDGMQNMLVVGQVKVNGQQNIYEMKMNLAPPAGDAFNKSFTSGQAMGTHRLANTSQLEGTPEYSQSEIGGTEVIQTIGLTEVEHLKLMERNNSKDLNSASYKPKDCNVGLIIIEDGHKQPRVQQQFSLNEQSFCAQNSAEFVPQLVQTQNANSNESQRSKTAALDMFNTDVVLYGGMGTETNNQYLFSQNSTVGPGVVASAAPLSGFDMTAVLLEDYKEFMKNRAPKTNMNQRDQSNYGSHAAWKTNQDPRLTTQEASDRTFVKNSNDGDEKSLATITTPRLNQIEDKVDTTEQKLQANLYKEYHVMKKLIEEPDGVTGTKVKTFSGHPSSLLKANRDKTAKKSSLKPEEEQPELKPRFNDIKPNETQVTDENNAQNQQKSPMKSLKNERRAKSAMQLHPHNKQPQQQRVILIKADPYKPFELAADNPRWSVPTSKRVIRGQPRQSKNRLSSCESADQKQQQQAYFYRTTRTAKSCDKVGNNLEAAESQQVLAIDHRNTINLQKVIDQYYDGDLSLDRLHNGDLHQMQMAQNNSMAAEDKKQSQEQQEKVMDLETVKQARPHSTLIRDETVMCGNGPNDNSAMNSKVQTVFSRDRSRRQSNESANSKQQQVACKKQLQGSKFKQSEMLGFRRVVCNLEQSPASKGEYSPSKTKNVSANVSHHGTTVTIDSNDYNPQGEHLKRKPHKVVQNHQVDVGPVPNQQQKSRALQYNDLMPQTQELPDQIDNRSNDTYGMKLSNSAGIPSQILSRRLKTPQEDEVTRAVDDGAGLINPALVNTLYKGALLDLTAEAPSFNKDLNQVIVNAENYMSACTLKKQSSARSLMKGQSSNEFSNKPQEMSEVAKTRREQLTQSLHKDSADSPHKGPSIITVVTNDGVDDAINFGVAGERINQQSRVQASYFATSTKAKIHKNLTRDYKESNDPLPLKFGRNSGGKDTNVSADLRTLSRGDSHVMSNSVDFQTAFGRTPVNRNMGATKIYSDKVMDERATDEDFEQKVENKAQILLASQQENSKLSKTMESESVKNRFELNEELSPEKKQQLLENQASLSFKKLLGEQVAANSIGDDRQSPGVMRALLSRKQKEQRKEQKRERDSSESPTPAEYRDKGEIESQHSSMVGASPTLLATAMYEKDQQQPISSAEQLQDGCSRSVVTDLASREKAMKEKITKSTNSPGFNKDTTPIQAKRYYKRDSSAAVGTIGHEQISNMRSRSQFDQRKRSDNKYSQSNDGKAKLTQKQISAPSLILFSVPTVVSNTSNKNGATLQKSPDKRGGRNFAASSGNSPFPIVKSGVVSHASRKQIRSASAKRATLPIQQSGERIVNIEKKPELEVRVTESTGELNKSGSGFQDEKPSSQRKGARNTQDTEVGGRDFKLVDSELGDEIADDLESGVHISQGELTMSKSPIRVQTMTVNKAENSRTQLNAQGDEIGNQSLEPADSSVTDLSINVIGLAAYNSQHQNVIGRVRPVTTTTGRRETLQMSQVPIGPHEFGIKSVARLGQQLARKQSITKQQQQSYGAKDPYISYLQNGETGIDSLLGSQKNAFGSQTSEVMSQTGFGQATANTQFNQYIRPKSSIQSFNQISRELKAVQLHRGHSQLLKRNMSMNRRKQELLVKGQVEKQKRLAGRDKKFTTVPIPRPIDPQNNTQTDATGQDDESQMRMIYSQKKRGTNETITSYQTQPLPKGVEKPMKTVFASNMATPDIVEAQDSKTLQKLKSQMKIQQVHQNGLAKVMTIGSRSMGDQDASIVEFNNENHEKLITKQLIDVDDSPDMKMSARAEVNLNDSEQMKETSKVSKITVSQSLTRISQTRSSTSMQAIREVQELLQMNQSTDRDLQDYVVAPYRTSKQIMTQAALQGQPAQGVGQEIQRKRAKMKELYKMGRRKALQTGGGNKTRQFSAMSRRPPTGLSYRRAASVLDSSLGVNASQSSFSVQGSSLKQAINPYISASMTNRL